MVFCIFLPCSLESHIYDSWCNGGGQSFYYLRVGEKQVLFLHPQEADGSLIGELYLCPQEYRLELALFLAPSNANGNSVNVKPKSQ